jgi:uncharacterized repeat protein (TIGR02543 family)
MNYNTIENKSAILTIGKVSYDMSGISFVDVSTTYDRTPHSILITGSLPSGVTVSYSGNAKTDAGTFKVTAKFTGESMNHELITDKIAYLTINKAPMTGSISIIGTPMYGEVLKANISLYNAGNPTYQWNRGGLAINGATSINYTLAENDIGEEITFTATAVSSCYQGSITSEPTVLINQKQLSIENPTITTSKEYDGNATAVVLPGALIGIVSDDDVTVQASGYYDSSTVETGKTITVSYILEGSDAGNYIQPADYIISTGTITPNIITFDKVSGTGGSDSVYATCGSAMGNATAPTRDGYAFGGYFTESNGEGTQYYTASMESSRNWDLSSSKTLYAYWIRKSFTISFDAQSGTTPEPSTMSVKYGVAYGTLPTTSRNGYSFNGWYTEENGGGTKIEVSTIFDMLEDIQLFADWNVVTGIVAGTVKSATSGQVVSGVTVSVKDNSYYSTTTNSTGYFSFAVPIGPQTLTFSATGYVFSDQSIEVGSTSTNIGEINGSPSLEESEYRFVLTWNATPTDLDSYLKLPNNSSINYSSKTNTTYNATLDLDDTNGYGPETITIKNLGSGNCHYYVHNYSGENNLYSSGAKVSVYSDIGLIYSIEIPTSFVTGLYWDVFSISNNEFTIINSVKSSI